MFLVKTRCIPVQRVFSFKSSPHLCKLVFSFLTLFINAFSLVNII